MAVSGNQWWLVASVALLGMFLATANGIDIFLEWNVAIDTTIKPAGVDQSVITINGMFPGPLINTTTNDMVHVNVFNNLDEPLLFTWNGIQQRLNSWQDGVSGTNCPIQPGTNWTYVFQTKDQIGSFFYFPSINFQKAGGGFGPIRVNNRNVIAVPFPKPEAEFDLLIGDWFSGDYKERRSRFENSSVIIVDIPAMILINGKGPYGQPLSSAYESFTFTKGKTYRLRISNVGSYLSLNFRIQNHKMVLVETEGSYTNQIALDSLDVHVGQSYSVLVTADQDDSDYYMVASPKYFNSTTDSNNTLVGVALLHYSNSNSNSQLTGPLPAGPDPFDLDFSVNQSRSIRWNMTAGAARPNPQGTFNVTNITLSQTFNLHTSSRQINGQPRYVVNNVSYLTVDTPLKLADYFLNGSGVYQLDWFPTQSVNSEAIYGVSVVTGNHKGWIELVFINHLHVVDSWHLDGSGLYVVGFGDGEWTEESRKSYNVYDPVVRASVQVYPRGWTAVYAFLDNPGMWNVRSQLLKHWYLGQEFYIRVFDADPNPAKERPPPQNMLLCGIVRNSNVTVAVPESAPTPAPFSG